MNRLNKLKKKNTNKIDFSGLFTKNRFILLSLFVLVIFMILQLFVLSMYGTQGEKISTVIRTQKALEQENEKLASDINNAQSLARVEGIAREKIALVQVSEIKSLSVDESVSLNK